ncbi:unnamed protein product [Diamesa serratosioi]
MGATHLYGKSVNILKFSTDNKVLIDKTELDKMFLDPEVKNRKIVIVSIIGAFRKGKSFFLDYCLRYMYANYKSIANPSNELNNPTEWMGPPEEPLQGFSWKSGVNRDTTGIIIWSDIFLHTNEFGEKLAIVLMDTQGLFDNETSPADNSRIFALGTLLSSVQILNLFSIIQEDQLQYLQFATEFARFAAKDSNDVNSKPFQNLLFLIRDWNNPDEFEFGMEGGENYLKKVLKIENNQKSELKTVRQFINASFEQINCCLMPHPGKAVARSSKYDGRWSKMDEEFKEELVLLIPKLLAPENLVLKKINSKDLNGFEMKEYIESYFTLFQSDTLPQAQSIYESTIDKQMNILIEKCMETYKLNIYKNQDLLTEKNLEIFHQMSKTSTILHYKEEKKMGNSEHEKKYRVELESRIEKLYNEWKERTLTAIKMIDIEKEKTEDALKEKLRLQEEAKEAERKSIQQIKDLDTAKQLNQIEAGKYEVEKKLVEARLEIEKERAISAEKQVKAEQEFREEQQEQSKNDKLFRQQLEQQIAATKEAQKPKKKGCVIL